MKNIWKKLDKPLLIYTILLVSIGLLMVFSSSSISAILRYHKTTYYFFLRQLLFIAVSLVGGLIILRIPTKTYKKLSWLLILAIIAIMSFLLVKGTITNHAKSWFTIPYINFNIQPSEFAKTILILFMACYYNGLVKKQKTNIFSFLTPLTFAAIIFLLTYSQPDLGSALIILGITFCLFVSVPKDKKTKKVVSLSILGLSVIVLIMVLGFKNVIFTPEQLSRFQFQNPCERYKEKTGYQVCNGYIALNNGGLTGVGLGKSTQKYLYLPESHTDFIFAILVEELGLITGLAVILLYVLFLLRILKIAKESYSLRNSMIAYGTFWLFTFHIMVNLGGLLAIMPLTGVPLPLITYGGSNTINFMVMIFLTERVAIENKDDKYKEELKSFNVK